MRGCTDGPCSTSAGKGTAKSAFGRLPAALAVASLAAIIIAALLPAAASAAVPVLKSSFTCSVATPCGSFTSATFGRLAVDEATGDVYVIDTANDAVEVFASDGTYLRQILGSSISPGAGTFSFGGEDDIAVDNSGGANAGNVYVNSQNSNATFAFDKTGAFLWQGSNSGTFLCGIAVDSSGNPWASDHNNGIQKLSPADGSFIGSPAIVTGDSCHFAFDSSGNVVLNHYNANIQKYDPAGNLLVKYRPGETNVDVTVNRSNDEVYSVVSETFSHLHGVIERWDADGANMASFGSNAVGVSYDGASETLYASETGQVDIYTPPASLTIQVTGFGAVRCKVEGGPEEACAGGYPSGTKLELVAIPGEGYVFAGWLGCRASAASSCELTVSGDTELTAVFLATVVVTPVPVGSEECPNGGVKVESGGSEEFVCAGSNGSNGSNGAAGPQGPQGASGPAGKDGAAGAQGAEGKQGPPGPAAKVTCRVKPKGKKVKVTCTVKQGASASRLGWRLSRRGRTYRRGTVRDGRLRLGALPPGQYRLQVEGVGQATEIVIG